MDRSKKVQLIQRDLMKVGENHGTAKHNDSLEAFIYALGLTLLTYCTGARYNKIKAGHKMAKGVIKQMAKMIKKGGK